MPTLKEVIKLEDKLISGEEIEIYPNFHVDNHRNTECVSRNTDPYLASKDSKQEKNPENESSKSCFKSDKSACTSNVESSITTEDYPKLYITVANHASDKNAMTKNSLLKNISGIQSSGGDSYGINISNSRFFVPKNYIFSDVESSMDDLKFEVDPEMAKLLQRSYSNPQISTSSPILVDVGTDPVSLNVTTAVKGMKTRAFDKTTSNDLTRQREECPRAHSDSFLVKLKSRESEKVERKQRLFLKKRDSKPSREIVDSLLKESTPRSKTSAVSQAKNRSNRTESSSQLQNRNSAIKGAEESKETKNTTRKLIPTSEKSHDSRIEAAEGKILQSNQFQTSEHVITDDCEIVKKKPATTIDDTKSLGTLEGSEGTSSSSKNIESNINSPILGKHINTLPDEVSGSHDFPNALSTRQDQDKRDGSFECNEQQQKYKYSNLSETNRANRIKFLQNSLQTGVSEYDNSTHDLHIEKASSKGKLSMTNEEMKISRNAMDLLGSIGKDQDSPFRRTSSLREKYETIVEDVELRTAPGRRSHVAISCGRKSLAHLSVLWEPRPLQVSVRPGKQCKVSCAFSTSLILSTLLCRPCCPLVINVARLSLFVSRDWLVFLTIYTYLL